MFKLLVLAVLAVYASATINFLAVKPIISAPSSNWTLEFIQGFNKQLNIDDDVNFDNCTDIPIITDINKTLHDLNKTNVSYIVIAEDAYKLYHDSNKIKKYCPQAESTYKAYFTNFSQAVKKDPKDTWANVRHNLNGSWDQVEDLIAELSKDFKLETGTQAGQDFGKLVAIALNGYINATTSSLRSVSVSSNFTLEFIQGFNKQLNIDNDVNFDNCTNIPIITDINKTLHDLNQTKVNYIEILKDVIKVYEDSNLIKQYCPQAETTYKAFFANFSGSVKTDPKKTWATVFVNVNQGHAQVQDLISHLSTDFQQEQGTQAGQDFAQIIAIALKGYIQEALAYFF